VIEQSDILCAAANLLQAGKPFVLITVVKAQGSTPRDAGAKMIWEPRADGGDSLVGTVGGGQFERLVLDAARIHFEQRTTALEHFALASDADQCCGGALDVFYEYHGAPRRLIIFGAGHVSRALADLLRPSSLEIVIVDDRPEWNSPKRFPAARRIGAWDAGIDIAGHNPAATLVCVMTCSHDTDLELLRRILHNPPAFTGLIGSRSKRTCFFRRLVASGIDEHVVQQVHCPIGVGDTGKEPRLLAISMAAQILLEAKSLATL
jgi:xanthine dehydrogenase accessory factor